MYVCIYIYIYKTDIHVMNIAYIYYIYTLHNVYSHYICVYKYMNVDLFLDLLVYVLRSV